jgi:hypothetical protein
MGKPIIDVETGEILSSGGGELTVTDRAKLALRGNDAELIALAESTKELVKIDTEDDYAEIKTAENVLVKTRLNIVSIGKVARADANAFGKAIIAEENRLLSFISDEEIRLKALRYDWDEAIRIEKGREFAEAEAIRVRYENVVTALTFSLNFGATIDDIDALLNRCESINLEVLDFLTHTQRIELGLLQLTSINSFHAARRQVLEMNQAKLAAQQLEKINYEEVERQQIEKHLKEQEAKALAIAPDADKLKAFANVLEKLEVPVMSSEDAQVVKLALVAELVALANRVRAAADRISHV